MARVKLLKGKGGKLNGVQFPNSGNAPMLMLEIAANLKYSFKSKLNPTTFSITIEGTDAQIEETAEYINLNI